MRFSLLLGLASATLLSAAEPEFIAHTIATDLTGGYQVVVADINNDGRPDLIALASGLPDLLWFENPGAPDRPWPRHVIASGFSHMINAAAYDYDGDGIPEIVLAHEFANEAKKSTGILSLLHHQGDPRQLWSVREIDRLTTSHRLCWADPFGDGKKVLVNAPLTGPNAEAPAYHDHVPLVFYRPGEWKREEISRANEGIQHGIFITDWDGNHRDAILTASFSGIHLYRAGKSRGWSREEISASGASDIAVGHLGKTRFIAAIEPWHGNQVVIYRQDSKAWTRTVVDDSLVDGHTIVTLGDWVVAGYRGAGHTVNLYTPDDKSAIRRTRHVLDNGDMAAASCAVADLNADARPDIVCIGSGTKNLKWYENAGKK